MEGKGLKKRLSSTVRERLPSSSRAQVGIGTLIVFIAMVLVAAIAAGVLINTAGFLQTKSKQTGQESSAQVSNRVVVVSGFGNVANSESVNRLNLTVMRSAGSNDINLSTATIEYIGPDTATVLTGTNSSVSTVLSDADGSNFAITAVKDSKDTVPVLASREDRFRITIDTAALEDGSSGLSEGETVKLKITTQSGATTIHRVTIPESLSNEEAVSV